MPRGSYWSVPVLPMQAEGTSPQSRLYGTCRWGKRVSMKKENTFYTWPLVVAGSLLPGQSGQSVSGRGFSGPWTQSSFQAGSLVLEGSCLQETP